MRRQRQALDQAATGLREAMAARYDEIANRHASQPRVIDPPELDIAGAFRADAEKWRSDRPLEVSVWQLPREYRPAGLESYDRVLVDGRGGLSVVRRHTDH